MTPRSFHYFKDEDWGAGTKTWIQPVIPMEVSQQHLPSDRGGPDTDDNYYRLVNRHTSTVLRPRSEPYQREVIPPYVLHNRSVIQHLWRYHLPLISLNRVSQYNRNNHTSHHPTSNQHTHQRLINRHQTSQSQLHHHALLKQLHKTSQEQHKDREREWGSLTSMN